MTNLIINDAFFQLEDQNQILVQAILASQCYKNYLQAKAQMNACDDVTKKKSLSESLHMANTRQITVSNSEVSARASVLLI